MKTCSKCKISKDENEFGKNKTKKDGLNYYCLTCRKVYEHNRHKINGDAQRVRSKAENKKRRAERRILIDSLKDKPCTDCHQSFPPCAMDFDHITNDKYIDVASMLGHSKEKLLVEVAKCELVCANCHRIRTHNRYAAKTFDQGVC